MPDIWMDVDIALSEVPVNRVPLIDDGDFKSRKTGLAYNAAGMDLVWNFVTTTGTFTQTAVTPTTAGAHDWTDQGDAMYTIEIPASSPGDVFNDTEGFGWFTGVITGALPWAGPTVGFRAATINDALVDSDTLLTSKDIGMLYESQISTVTGQTEFIMLNSITSDDNWIGNIVTIEDVSTGETVSRWVTDVVQSTNTIHINSAPPFTVISLDIVRVHHEEHTTYALNTYDPPTRTEASTDTATVLTALNVYSSEITTVTSQTEFICTENIATDDNWIGQIVEIEDVTNNEKFTRRIVDVVASTDTIIIDSACPVTIVASDLIRVYRDPHPTYALNVYDSPTHAELTAYVQLMVRKDSAIATDNATEVTAINADEGSGAGDYDNTTDSLEASRIAIYESAIVSGFSQTNYILEENIISDDNWLGQALEIEDVSTGEINIRRITNVVAATNEIWVDSFPDFTVVLGDVVRVRSVHPIYALNVYDPPTRTELTSDTDSILSKMLNYFRISLRNDSGVNTDNATELTAVNSDQGSGGGTYGVQDSLQDIKSDTSNTLTKTIAIQLKTDDLTFTVANQVDANIQYVNDIQVSGDGGSGTEWGP